MTIDFVPRKFGVVLWLANHEGSWGIGDADSLSDLFVRADQVLEHIASTHAARILPHAELRMTFLNEAIQHADKARVEIERIYRFKLRTRVE